MSKKKEHGISEALYVGGPGEPYYKPFIACLCGWHTENGSPRTWEEAGAELDVVVHESSEERLRT